MDWLIDIRNDRRLTQCEVATLADISQSHYAAIENCVRMPSVKTAKKIADVLGFEWTRFFETPAQPAASA